MVYVPSPNYLKVGKGDSCIQSVNGSFLWSWMTGWCGWGLGWVAEGSFSAPLLPLLPALVFFLRLTSPLPVFLTVLPNKPFGIQILILGVCFWGNQRQGAVETTIHSTISRVPNPGFRASEVLWEEVA